MLAPQHKGFVDGNIPREQDLKWGKALRKSTCAGDQQQPAEDARVSTTFGRQQRRTMLSRFLHSLTGPRPLWPPDKRKENKDVVSHNQQPTTTKKQHTQAPPSYHFFPLKVQRRRGIHRVRLPKTDQPEYSFVQRSQRRTLAVRSHCHYSVLRRVCTA